VKWILLKFDIFLKKACIIHASSLVHMQGVES
jgi:hypothetical protein